MIFYIFLFANKSHHMLIKLISYQMSVDLQPGWCFSSARTAHCSTKLFKTIAEPDVLMFLHHHKHILIVHFIWTTQSAAAT